jgi:hypothetical protein
LGVFLSLLLSGMVNLSFPCYRKKINIYVLWYHIDVDLPDPRVEVCSQDHSLSPLSRIISFSSLLESQFNWSTGPFEISPMQIALGASSTSPCNHDTMTKA